MELVILIIYGTSLLLILFYSLMQANLVINYKLFHKKNKNDIESPLFDEQNNLPYVTIQLPIYNELYVVNRLIDAVAEFNYPLDRFEIQVIDDSTDETLTVSAQKVKEIEEKGISISHNTREKRTGYKAGALAEATKVAKGEFIAIFDADFIPDPDFLKKTLPYFNNEKVGVVQTKWGHINKDFSLLTELQAFGLNAHFSIEQVGRNYGGHCINFNGTAGIWRKSCIEDAGGWEHDTLTEDLDLSYRAQLKGWKFKYLEDVISPAELPVVMSAVKNQQFRWNKGGAENFRKMAKNIVKTKNVSFKTKVHGLFHLFNSSVFLFILITSLLSIPTLYIKKYNPQYSVIFAISTLFLISMILLMIYYWVSYADKKKFFLLNVGKFMIRFFTFLSFSMGLALHNAVAVLEGYSGKKSSFVRTPKFNILSNKDQWKSNKYLDNKISLVTILEGFLCLYFLFGILSAFYLEDYGLLPFHFMLFMGFGSVFFMTFRHLRK